MARHHQRGAVKQLLLDAVNKRSSSIASIMLEVGTHFCVMRRVPDYPVKVVHLVRRRYSPRNPFSDSFLGDDPYAFGYFRAGTLSLPKRSTA